ARKHHARSIVLMKPSLPMGWFDLCIAPSHDFPKPPATKNLLISRGALNRVAPVSGGKSGQLILIGGPSSNHGWDAKKLLAALTEITSGGHWLLTDSRRTPEGFSAEIRKSLPTIEIFPHQETTPDWLPGTLAAAGEVWVTEDSVSMIYEALSSGAKVGLLPVHELGSSRVLRGVEQLVTAGFLTRFSDWEKSRNLTAPPETLREADRCAAEVLKRLSR
ncbi:MAG: ELM1/GtrOC1 family putative glycosyltransferase, partial [Luteolibacter sp.]